MKVFWFLIVAAAFALTPCSCSMQSDAPPSQGLKVAISTLEDTWYLENTTDEEFDHFLPLARKGDIEAIKRIIVYYRNRDMQKEDEFWMEELNQADEKAKTVRPE